MWPLNEEESKIIYIGKCKLKWIITYTVYINQKPSIYQPPPSYKREEENVSSQLDMNKNRSNRKLLFIPLRIFKTNNMPSLYAAKSHGILIHKKEFFFFIIIILLWWTRWERYNKRLIKAFPKKEKKIHTDMNCFFYRFKKQKRTKRYSNNFKIPPDILTEIERVKSLFCHYSLSNFEFLIHIHSFLLFNPI